MEISENTVYLIGSNHKKQVNRVAALPYPGLLINGVIPDDDKLSTCMIELNQYFSLSGCKLNIGLPINSIIHTHFTLNESIPTNELDYFNEWAAQFFTNSPPKAFNHFYQIDRSSDTQHYDYFFLRKKILDQLTEIRNRYNLSISFIGLTIQRILNLVQRHYMQLFQRNLLFIYGHSNCYTIICWYNNQTAHYFTLSAINTDNLFSELNDQLFVYNLQIEQFDLAMYAGDNELQSQICTMLKNNLLNEVFLINIYDYLTLSEGIRSQLTLTDKLQSFVGAFSLL